jgi:hypothetical protein
MDYFSKWLELIQTPGKTAKEAILACKAVFARNGIPEKLRSDNMPFISSEFLSFAREWDFIVVTSSPLYPKSNGMAERAVQTSKNILKKAYEENTDMYYALLQYRNTPITGVDRSPAQLLLSRQLRSKVPVLKKVLLPKIERNVRKGLQQNQLIQKSYYDRNAKSLPPLREGDSVLLRRNNYWEKGMVMAKHQAPRSYVVKTENDGIYRRNRSDLRASFNPPPDLRQTIMQGPEEVQNPTRVSESEYVDFETAPAGSPLITGRTKRITRLPSKFQNYDMSR